MRKIFFIMLTVMVLGALNVRGGTYYISDLWSGISCIVSMYQENGTYSMELYEDISLDIIYTANYSSGTFEITGQHIYFFDTLYGLKMTAQISDDKKILNFNSGFSFMLNREFKFSGEEEVTSDSIPRVYLDNAKAHCIDNYTYNIATGRYFNQYNSMNLHLKDDGTFSYYLIGILMLKGTWKQDKNIIILTDERLNHKFHLICEKPNLRTMLLPGDDNLEGTVLEHQ